jgi:hypothetical protein
MSARSAYHLRARVRQRVHSLADAPMTPAQAAALGPGYVYSFAAAWDVALDRGVALQLDAALPVALEGEQVPVIRRGRIVGWRRRFNMRLAINALGAWRRSYEGRLFDHEVRTAQRTEHFAEKIEAMFRLGPARWPRLEPDETREERLARQARQREEERVYGRRSHGLLDPTGPAGRPPRTLEERAAERLAASLAAARKWPPSRPGPGVRTL